MTVPEALAESAREMLEREIATDEAEGKEKKLPSGYRMVIHLCASTQTTAVATPDGPVEIPQARAIELLDGAEILDLTRAELPRGEKAHTCALFESEVLSGKRSLIQHSTDLSTPDRPPVPPDERDHPTTPEERLAVLSRDGFFCSVPGCGKLARFCHHIVWKVQGGRTVLKKLVGLCGDCHDLAHEGCLLVSGTAGDLRISGRDRKPLLADPGTEPPLVALEVETPPVRPEIPDLPPAAPSAPARAEVSIPAGISPRWWLAHRHLFDWCERRRLLVYHPERALEEGGSLLPEPPVGEAPPGGALLEGFRGQKGAVERLSAVLQAARLRGEPPPAAVLLCGPPGLGKTTLARLAAAELGTRLHVTAGPLLQDPGVLVGMLSSLRSGDVLFIDEIHGLTRSVAECLYPALDHRKLALNIACGVETRAVTLQLEPFFLIGATTEEGTLPRPFHSRFRTIRLGQYSTSDLEAIAIERGKALGMEVTPKAASRLAQGSRGTPRELVALLEGARDVAQIEAGRAGMVTVTSGAAERALGLAGVDGRGLRDSDRKILRALEQRGRPLGLRTLSDLTGEAPRTLLEIHEPYLLREGYLTRTFRGRVITEKGKRLLAG